MAQIETKLNRYSRETVKIQLAEEDLTLARASETAKQKARAMDPNAMMLSYHSGKTGEFWPAYTCGGGERPPWIVFAEARGYNLMIDINDGEFEFFYLRL